MKITLLLALNLFMAFSLYAQKATLSGTVKDENGRPIEMATVALPKFGIGAWTDSLGRFDLTEVPPGEWKLEASFLGHESYKGKISVQGQDHAHIDIVLTAQATKLDEVVVSGTLKEVSKLDSPVPIEVYTSQFFKANPTPSLFDALQNINGVRPQLNCNICNTGDIHINGLEGPYTMVLIDGMPIVSGLSSVYGLSGIPQSLIDRVEVVKGPASTLYGSEAVGGLINVITKRPDQAPLFSADLFATTWQEVSADLATKFRAGTRASSLLGINYFNYQRPRDDNGDGFTDLTLQNRVSVFNKWSIHRPNGRLFSIAGRYVYEDRWGGQMGWSKRYRGGDEVYGESIYTKRWETFGTYQLPGSEQLTLSFSANGHNQDSYYGETPFMADQYIGFLQLTWNKALGKHDVTSGLAYRFTYYDDNTPATASPGDLSSNQPSIAHLPGLFVQDEIALDEQNKLLLGLRYDYNSLHGNILTPRINYKWSSKDKSNVLRASIGNGYRVANIFTEDHAALTGAREVVFMEELKPETSWNGNLNFVKKIYWGRTFIGLDATAFYTYFGNKIIADYDTDPNKIVYGNLEGHAISKGVSLNIDMLLGNGLKLMAGGTLMDVFSEENGERSRQLFTERAMAVWNIGYALPWGNLSIDYTGNLYGPMRLPLLSPTDPRREYSPWWSIQNIQVTKKFRKHGFEIYAGVKNLLDWTPNKGNPFIIARANDPFDKQVTFGADGQALVTPDNPYGLTFDPSYVYGPNQGIRGFLGFRYNLSK